MPDEKEAPEREQKNLQNVSTSDLVNELVARGAMKISTELYSGYELKKLYVKDRSNKYINAKVVLVFSPDMLVE